MYTLKSTLHGVLCRVVWIWLMLLMANSMVQAQTTNTLTLKSFLRSVMEYHPAARSARLENNIATAKLTEAQGSFDPVLKGDYEFKQQKNDEKIDAMDAGIEAPLATLFAPTFSAKYKRGEGTGINPERIFENNGIGALGVSVPLWQGVLTDANRTKLAQAEAQPLFADAQIRKQINDLLLYAGETYWKWSEAYAQVRIAQQLVNLADLRNEQVKIRVRAGREAAIDSIESQQEVQKRRAKLIEKQIKLEQATNTLTAMIWGEDNQVGAISGVPEKLYVPSGFDSTSLEQNRSQALETRPELKELDFQSTVVNLDIELAEERAKPMVESQMQWLFTPDAPKASDYQIGLNMYFPILQRKAGGQEQAARIKLDQIRLKRADLERKILAQVDNALVAFSRSLERLTVSEREVELATLLEKAERRKSQEGQSSLLVVNIRERYTGEARSRLAEAQADCLRALVRYYWAVGQVSVLTE